MMARFTNRPRKVAQNLDEKRQKMEGPANIAVLELLILISIKVFGGEVGNSGLVRTANWTKSMPNPLNVLKNDHHNLSALLAVLNSQISLLTQNGTADLEIIEQILVYCQHYGDQHHHPLENLLYSQMVNKDPRLAQRLAHIEEEHEQMYHGTSRLLEEIREARLQCVAPSGALIDLLAKFLDGYKKHMAEEDRVLFPMAQEHLAPADWSQIQNRAENLPGAEHAKDREERFLALRDYIHRLQRLSPAPQ